MQECSGDSDRYGDWQIPTCRPRARIWAGKGTGATCSFCGYSIQAHEIEYEIELAPPSTERIVRLHFHCHRRWEVQVGHVDQS
jgi:hypothetical protein